ncbi:MAG: hypothetical protein IJR00_05805 [Lachnospiraceae bacterium]|nr:hypothetical protein [Lachnospiraceae bacterium]
MAFLFRDDGYDASKRQTGFARYRQLLSYFGFAWWKAGFLTVLGLLPLAFGIVSAILLSSFVVLLPASLAGGMIFGPFLAALYDAVMRGLRFSPDNWWASYKRSWKQNWKASLFPGALLGLMLGAYAFMAYIAFTLDTWRDGRTIAAYLLSAFLLVLINSLYWPQLVLFSLPAADRIRNMILFTAKYLWRVTVATLLQVFYWALYIFFAPWSLVLMPLLGIWFIVFLSELILYDGLNAELRIEEQFYELEGDPFEEEDDTEDLS